MPLDSVGTNDIEKTTISHDECNYANSTRSLSPEHYDYLMQRHGTVDLDPLPSSDPNDPLNWPNWQKNYEILSIAFGTFTSTFMASGMQPSYEAMAEKYGVSISDASYFTSVQICVFGILPLVWIPLMNTYGRKPFLTVGALFCCALNIGGGFCQTYGQQMATRVLNAVFISTVTSAGGSVVGDLAFAHERGKKNGWWSLGFVLGTPGGSFITGFIQYHAGTRWVFWVFAIMNFIQFLLWIVSRETVYSRGCPDTIHINYIGIRKSSARPFSWFMFIRPLKHASSFNITMAVIAASVTFCYGNIVLSVEMPQVMISLFHLNAQQMSLQFISLIIGSVIGEIIAGPLSDWWMKRCTAKRNGRRVIVDRLWLTYDGYLLVIVGLIVWGVYLTKATPNHWSIKPLVGAAITAAGNNKIATVITTFAIDNDPKHAGEVSVYINLVRSLFGFIGPFYFPSMFENLGFAGSAGLMCGLVFLFGGCTTLIVHFCGWRRERQYEKSIK
ncbi:hypothetical protein KGF56_003707 [Candida oxycetoniae]|uniref:Major facilitator superfamily (MFS) profile domain-containing protein n=1 Tax=Candida oxycetoniae TaxID=497107 RepID=A0AAI9SUS6_9ASCO|nr:uncharacterized protein KGF56_003707 [Candida oxycetoniae]KAI3403423.2 hypothetical protein KGF56_003707 [Candida oxycetoniae]